MDLKNQLEKIEVVPDRCYLYIHIKMDETAYVLEINYMGGKFVAERNFPVNQRGVADMEETKRLYKNESDFQKHFGLI